MTAYVRVLLPNGWEATLSEAFAATAGLQILNKPAVDRRGRPLPATLSTETPQPPTDDTCGALSDLPDLSLLFENGLT